MTAVKIAELKNGLSRYLSVVREGAELVVYDRDTPVARLVPFAPREDAGPRRKVKDDYWTTERLAALERQGVIRRGDAPVTADGRERHRPVRLPKGAPSVVDLLLKTRQESAR